MVYVIVNWVQAYIN